VYVNNKTEALTTTFVVVCKGSILPADVVVSNVDAPFTTKYLLPPAFAQVKKNNTSLDHPTLNQ
jgi:hypothetical protein